MYQNKCNPNFDLDFEQLLTEYFEYKKTLDQQAIQAACAEYQSPDEDLVSEDLSYDIYTQSNLPDEIVSFDPLYSSNDFNNYSGHGIEINNYTYEYNTPSKLYENPYKEIDNPISEDESFYIHNLHSPISQKLSVSVEKILNEYEFENNPLYSENFDKEALAQIVDKVISHAKIGIEEIQEISTEMDRHGWGRYHLLRALSESLVLRNIYYIRRPRHHKHREYHFYK